MGINASALSHSKHEELLGRLRQPGSKISCASGSLDAILAEFSKSNDIIVVIGWNVDEEPSLLIPGDALAQSQTFFRTAYPDGFVVTNQPVSHALMIDFDESDIEVEAVFLAVN